MTLGTTARWTRILTRLRAHLQRATALPTGERVD